MVVLLLKTGMSMLAMQYAGILYCMVIVSVSCYPCAQVKIVPLAVLHGIMACVSIPYAIGYFHANFGDGRTRMKSRQPDAAIVTRGRMAMSMPCMVRMHLYQACSSLLAMTVHGIQAAMSVFPETAFFIPSVAGFFVASAVFYYLSVAIYGSSRKFAGKTFSCLATLASMIAFFSLLAAMVDTASWLAMLLPVLIQACFVYLWASHAG